jgi:peptide deformylase
MSTMMKKRNGCGLAAPQVGLSVRMFVWSDPTGRIESAINPVLEELKGGDFNSEGCLSIPGVHGYVKRFERLILIGNDPYDPKSRFSTKIRDRWIARIVQHEFDHLDGKLFFERFDDKDKQINERALQALRECWLAGKEPLEKRKEVDVGNRSS